MRVQQIAFTAGHDEDYDRVVSVISDSLVGLTNTAPEPPLTFHTISGGMLAIREALPLNDILLIFAEQSMFNDAKIAICEAFSFDMIHSEAVMQHLRGLGEEDDYTYHTLMPKNSTPFPLNDGLYSGFAIHSKDQTILYLPLEMERSFPTMRKYVIPYIKRIYGIQLNRFADQEIRYAADLLAEKMRGSNARIAVATTEFSKHIAKAARMIDVWDEHVSYAPYDRTKIGRAVDSAAVSARSQYGADYGVSVLEIPPQDLCFTVQIAVASRDKAMIRTISSIPDETHDDFMHTVTAELFLMLADILADPAVLDGPDGKKGRKRVRSIPISFVIVMLLLLVFSFAATVILYLYFKEPATLLELLGGLSDRFGLNFGLT